MRIATKARGVGLVLALTLAAGAGAGQLSLRVEGITRESSAALRSGQVTVTYQLVNRSEKTITAWYFGCISVSQLGQSSLTYNAADAYYGLGSKEPGAGSNLLTPGATIAKKVVFQLDQDDGPYAARSCAPTLVVFEDGTYEGDSQLATAVFTARAADALEVWRAHAELSAAVKNGSPLLAAVASLAAAQALAPPVPGSTGLVLARLRTFEDLVSQGVRAADSNELLAELQGLYENAMKNLPKDWQVQVAKELNR